MLIENRRYNWRGTEGATPDYQTKLKKYRDCDNKRNDMNSYRHASGEGSSVADVVYLAHFIPFFRYMITLCRNIKHITIGTRNDSQTPLYKGENVSGKW